MYRACAAWCQLTECMEKLIKTHAFTRFSYYRLVLLFYEILHSEGVVLFCVRSLISDHVKKKWQLKISGIWKMTSLVVNNPRITCSCASEEFSENIKLNSFREKALQFKYILRLAIFFGFWYMKISGKIIKFLSCLLASLIKNIWYFS